MSHGLFKNWYRQTIRLQTIYLIYMYKQDLALNSRPKSTTNQLFKKMNLMIYVVIIC